MQFFWNCGVFVLTNKKLAVSVAILLALSSTAIWDIALIIDDYINNNRITLVKLENVNDTIPYLQNEQIKVCIYYGENSVFQELWGTQESRNITNWDWGWENLDLASQFFKNTSFSPPDEVNRPGIKFNHRFASAVLVKGLQDMDMNMIDRIKITNDSHVPPEYLVLDDLLRNLSYSNILINERSERQGSMIWNWNSEILPLQFLDWSLICVRIPVSTMITHKENKVTFFAGFVEDIKRVASKNNTAAINLSLSLTDKTLHEFIGINNTWFTEISLVISNIGVFKKQPTKECLDEPIYYLTVGSPSFYEDCSYQIPLEIFTNICHCIPFSFKDLLPIVSTTTLARDLPFCSSDKYNNCFKRAQEVLRNQPCLPPCTINKNLYSVTYSSSLPEADVVIGLKGGSKCSRTRMIFECKDFNYAIYEERVQISLSQLLSQIGGDLGLYTGFSLLGLWQFFVFTSSLYRNHRKSKIAAINNSSPQEKTSRKAVKKTLSTLLVHYLEDTTETTSTDTNNQQTAIALECSQIKICVNHLLDTVNGIKEQQKQFQMQMHEIVGFITAINNTLAINKIQRHQSDVTVCDL